MRAVYADSSEDWAAYTHNDWLETRITLGWVGLSMVVLMLLIVLAHYFVGAGVSLSLPFAALIGIALGGCLLHAVSDFPFQIHSILFVFLFECAMLFSAASATRRV